MNIEKAMILAAGLGTRMRPLTNTIPKPLVPIGGKPLIDWGLDALKWAGVKEVVVNVHYLADQVEAHVKSCISPSVIISNERDKLQESGGGIVKARSLLGDSPFYVLNSDTFWLDAAESNLLRLARFFDESRMSGALLLVRHEEANGHGESSDFMLLDDGRIRRTRAGERGYIYGGAGIFHPNLFENSPKEPHSLNREFDEALHKNRLFGMVLEGKWVTVGTVEAIAAAEAVILRPLHYSVFEGQVRKFYPKNRSLHNGK